MKAISKLTSIFKPILGWHKSRIDLLACFVVALITTRSVNLTEIAAAMPGKAKQESKYKRLKRFFADFDFSFKTIGKLIVKMLPIGDEPWDLSMDRTNWKLGKKNINPLVIGIVRFGVAFPLRWITFSKRGNSNTDERISLMNWFLEVFGLEKIGCLFADREFVGEKWFGYLLGKGIHFCIRVKENFLVSNSRGQLVSAKDLFRHLKTGESLVLSGKRLVNDHRLHVVGMRLSTGELLILVTDKCPDQALENYKKRWGIETLFQCLKKRGFNFEDTRMTIPERIDKLIALLAITFTWCHVVGEWRNEQQEIKIKKHGRKAVSVFRYGLDCLRTIFINFHEKQTEFFKIVDITLKPLTLADLPLLTR
jgi:hypothetical protein